MAEPVAHKREKFAATHHIAPEYCFESWEDILALDKFADAAIIATQDTMHFEPTMLALEKGYHVLLEKPISGNKHELIALREQAKRHHRSLSIAHVLRYSDIFSQIKHVLDRNEIGEVKSIQHQENIAYWHYAHSFVRGPWHNKAQSNPIILAKACHDMDLLVWYANAKCTRVASFGNLRTFSPANKPAGATDRCISCPHVTTCLYSAPRIYAKERVDHLARIVVNENGTLENGLAVSDYGRCVYDMDNDVMESQVTVLEFENGVEATFHLCAFTNDISRYIHIMGSEGELRANTMDRQIVVNRFAEDETRIYPIQEADSGHEGGDFGIMRNFIDDVKRNDFTNGRTSVEKSIMSHLMALAAEEARLTQSVIDLETFELS